MNTRKHEKEAAFMLRRKKKPENEKNAKAMLHESNSRISYKTRLGKESPRNWIGQSSFGRSLRTRASEPFIEFSADHCGVVHGDDR